jgi:hypothetical protein
MEQTCTSLLYLVTGHNPPSAELCALHPTVCAVASACGVADVFNKLSEHDPDVVGSVAGQYTLPTDPTSNYFVIPLERRWFEESIYVQLL